MLEIFFDDEKCFSVFERILKSRKLKVNVLRICYDLGLSVQTTSDIIEKFVFLDIIKPTDSDEEFVFNPKSDVVIGLCLFDEIVGKYCINKSINDGEVDIQALTLEEFLEEIKRGSL